jgi:hypothetical protein
MFCAFHYLYCNISRIFKVFSQPYSGEMPPSKFLDDNIAIEEDFSNMTGMIAA